MIKPGLGRGLDALIPTKIEDDENIQEIRIKDIRANRYQPRRNFDEEKISELAKSIKNHGVLQPILLRKMQDKYELVAGERRWRAAIEAGIDTIPAIIKDISDTEAMEIALIENIQREDLNPIEEALAYRELMEGFGLTQEELSSRLGKSRSKIANTIRLLNLDKEIQNMIADGKLTAGHARALLGIKNRAKRINLAKRIVEENLSVRDIEEIIKQKKSKPKKNRPKLQDDNPVFQEISDNLQSLLGTKVKMKGTESKGKIEIEYYSEDELDRVLHILLD